MTCAAVIKIKTILVIMGLYLLSAGILYAGPEAVPVKAATKAATASARPYALKSAVICENIVNNQPVNSAVVFSVSRKKIYCFTAFEDVRTKTAIYHNWIRHGYTVARIKLLVQPPRWSTSSSLHFRDSDRGPWRVEITNEAGKILAVLRFSIIE